MKGLIAAEGLKLRARRLPWILLASLVGVLAALYTLIAAAVAASGASPTAADWAADLEFRNTIRFGDAIVFRVVAILCVVLAAVGCAAEYRWRTVVTQAVWTGWRGRLLAARVVTVSVASVIVVVLGFVSLVGVSFVTALVRSGVEPGEVGSWVVTESALASLRAVPPVFLFVAFAVFFATAGRSSAPGIAFPLIILLLEPIGTALLSEAGGAAGALAEFTPSRNIDALLAANGLVEGSTEKLPEGLPSAWGGAAYLLVLSAGLVLATARLVMRREIRE